MDQTRNNHYVPQWYQTGFIQENSEKLVYLDLSPDKILRPDGTPVIGSDGQIKTHNDTKWWHPTQCFFQTDLYSTFLGPFVNDEIERKLFGKIDDLGSKAVRAFISQDISAWHNNFFNFFNYIDAQKIRTLKGLDWIKSHYPHLQQNTLMREMQGVRNMHCTIWSEGVREIVCAKESKVKFIVSDHPVTIYNYAHPPSSTQCAYPNDPAISLKGTQTLFPLDKDHCLILTNYEYAKNPSTENPLEKRTFAKNNRNSMVRTDAFIRTRDLNEEEVKKINLITKLRAKRYIAGGQKEWLYPERDVASNWDDLRHVLLPPKEQLSMYGAEMYAGFEDGSTYYQDAFGRTKPENTFLKKPKRKVLPKPNEYCPCGYGRKFKKCCADKTESQRPSWEDLSIRERNITFFNGLSGILGMDEDKTWDDIRKEISDEQVKKIYELYAFLWPIETDILNLLPKPDNSARVLYTGIIDPRVISEFAISLTPYFDEIIIQNPMMNPNCVSSEFNPIEHPHKYKQQALKDILLFIELMPFIEMGYINYVPDICNFDMHLQSQMLNMARERSKESGATVDEKDIKIMEMLHKDDFERSIFMMPESYQRQQLRDAIPELDEDQIKETIKYIEEKNKTDPLTVLQKDLFTRDGGQFSMINLSPNFEMALFLCQVTGSSLITDSCSRWNEIIKAQYKDGGIVTYDWESLTELMNGVEYRLNANLETNFQIRSSGKLGQIRKITKEIHLAIRDNHNQTEINFLIETLKKHYRTACDVAEKELGEVDGTTFKGRFLYLAPKGGVVHNNVQRMLLTYGSDMHMKEVPIAILVEHIHK